jgi:hypothetical protein
MHGKVWSRSLVDAIAPTSRSSSAGTREKKRQVRTESVASRAGNPRTRQHEAALKTLRHRPPRNLRPTTEAPLVARYRVRFLVRVEPAVPLRPGRTPGMCFRGPHQAPLPGAHGQVSRSCAHRTYAFVHCPFGLSPAVRTQSWLPDATILTFALQKDPETHEETLAAAGGNGHRQSKPPLVQPT